MSAARWKAFARRWRIGELSAAALLLAAFLALVHRIYAPPPAAKPKPDRVLRIRIVDAPPPAPPSPVEHIRSAFDPQARCEMPPEPISTRNFKYIDPEAWFEWDEGGVDWPSIIEEDHDPCGPGPSLPQMDNNGFLPYQRVNPWALSLRGFARTPRCRGCYSYPAALNSGTCHAPPPE